MKKNYNRLPDYNNSQKAMEAQKINRQKPKKVKWLLNFLLIIILGFGSSRVAAQQFPVRATTVITPPYSIYLSDYSSPESNSLQLILQLRDLDRPQYRAKLRLTIEGQGITIRTTPGYSPNPIILQGGVPETLTGFDLRGYLNPDNLEFSGITKNDFIKSGALPEGFYTFTIEVLDFNRNVVVSNPAMANAWLILNDPPLINLPFNGDKVRASDPQNILFSWTPRHTASPNAAFSTEYEFTLVELFPTGRNPNDAILTSNPIFKTVTSISSLNYGIVEPILIPGRQYAFRVRAFDVGGRDLFKNNGASEVFVFQFGDECLQPTNLSAKSLDPNRVELTWEGQEIHTEFDIRYRKEGSGEWFQENTFSNKQIVPQLEGNTTYEYQIRGKCSSVTGPYTASSTIKTDEIEEEAFICGSDIPDIILETNPLQTPLNVGDEIETADFKITISELEANSDGSYKGMGIAQVPYLEFASIRVKFDAIKVNEAYRVFEGNITSVYDVNSNFILDADLTGDDLNQGDDDPDDDGGGDGDIVIPNPSDDFFDNYDFEDTVSVDQPILDVQVNSDGDIVITYEDENGDIKEQIVDPEEGEDTLITDSDGNSWGVDEGGNVTANPTNTPTPIEDASQVDYVVSFKESPSQTFGFDNKTYEAGQYDQTQIKGSDYWVSWKSVALGRQDPLIAITEKNTFPAEVGFKSTQGPGASQPSDKVNEKVITVTGKAADAIETIDAYVTIAGDDGNEELIIGKVNVKTYTNVRNRLIIVPVNDVSVPSQGTLAEEINKIFGQAVAEWDITVKSPYEVSGDQITGIADGQSGIFSSFPSRMQQFNRNFKNSLPAFDKNAYYLFLMKGSEAGKSGFMPFKRQFGYIFTDKLNGTPLTKVIAHELSHGAFRLRHNFSEFAITQGSTDNLMDYSSGTKLKKYQWDNVHDPESMISWLKDDEESEYSLKDLVTLNLNNVEDKEAFFNNNGFMLTSGSAIKLPSTVTKVRFNKYSGAIYEFDLGSERYSYVGGANSFIGFVKSSKIKELKISTGDILTTELEAQLIANRYQLTPLPIGKKVVAMSQQLISERVYADCYCQFSWAYKQNTNPLYGNNIFKKIPSEATKGKCSGTECDNLNLVNGIGTEIYVYVTRNRDKENKSLTDDEKVDFQELCNWLSDTTNGKTFTFGHEDLYDFYTGDSSLVSLPVMRLFHKYEILSKEKFNDFFAYTTDSRDVDLIFSHVDLWKNVDRNNYNVYSVDFKRGGRYHYSYADLVARYKHLFMVEGNNAFLVVISNFEASGSAEAISLKDGYEQYVAQFGTDDAWIYIASTSATWAKDLLGAYFLRQLVAEFGLVIMKELAGQLGKQIIREKGRDAIMSAVIDYGLQIVFNYYFNPNITTWEQAYDSKNINWIACAASALEGTVRYKNIFYELGISSSWACFVNGFTDQNGIKQEFSTSSCVIGVGSAILGKGIGKGIGYCVKWGKQLAKYSVTQLREGLEKMGITGNQADDIIGNIKGSSNIWDDWFATLSTSLKSDINSNAILKETFENASEPQRKALKTAWEAIADKPTLRIKPENLNILASVKSKLKFKPTNSPELQGDDALKAVLNGKSSIQKFVDNLAKADDYFKGVDGISFKVIKSSPEVRIVDDAGNLLAKVDDKFTKTQADEVIASFNSGITSTNWYKNFPEGLQSDISANKGLRDLFTSATSAERQSFKEVWDALSSKPTLRIKPKNLEILAPIKTKFIYGTTRGPDALKELLNRPGGVQKFIDNVESAEQLFKNIEVKHWSGIKSSSEVRLVNDANVVIGKINNGSFTVTAAKGSRPEPSTYLKQSYIDDHIAKFDSEGGAFIVVKTWIEGGSYNAFPLKKYAMLKSDMESAINTYKSSGNVSDLEKALGYNSNDLKGLENELYVFYPKSSKYKFEMPSGNEIGANNKWEPGGWTSGGRKEAVLIDKSNASQQITHNKSIDDLKNLFSWDKIEK